jgi:starch phosphorylase
MAARAEESKRNPRLSCLPTAVEGIEALAELALDRRWSWNHAADHVW